MTNRQFFWLLMAGFFCMVLLFVMCRTPDSRPLPPGIPSASSSAPEPPTPPPQPAPPASTSASPGPSLPPSTYKGGIELVRAAVGRWQSETPDGPLGIAIDPPNPTPPGKKPPYHLIVTRAGRTAYGCDFSDPTVVKVPKKIDGYSMTFRAWCGTSDTRLGAGRGAFIGLSLDTGYLLFALAVGDAVKVSSGPMVLAARR